MFLGTGLSVPSALALGITSVGFGLAHLRNKHPNAHLQAVCTTIAGITFGTLYQTFGLGAAIGAHVCNNTILVTLIKILDPNTNPRQIDKRS